jgi:uncharacterized membrane protein (GlpM family)
MVNFIKKYIIPVLLLGFLKITEALAQEGGAKPSDDGGAKPDISGKLTNPLGTTDIMVVLDRIFQFLAALGVPLLVIFIAIGGFQILGAQGNPEKIKTGKNTVLYAVIGYIVVLCAWGFIYIIKQVLGAK